MALPPPTSPQGAAYLPRASTSHASASPETTLQRLRHEAAYARRHPINMALRHPSPTTTWGAATTRRLGVGTADFGPREDPPTGPCALPGRPHTAPGAARPRKPPRVREHATTATTARYQLSDGEQELDEAGQLKLARIAENRRADADNIGQITRAMGKRRQPPPSYDDIPLATRSAWLQRTGLIECSPISRALRAARRRWETGPPGRFTFYLTFSTI